VLYRSEEWIGGRWEPVGIIREDLAYCIWSCSQIQRRGGNSVRVVDPHTFK
jgi:hypothetical protein